MRRNARQIRGETTPLVVDTRAYPSWRRRMARLPRTVAWLETAWCVDVDRILIPCRTTDYYTFTATPGAPMIE